MSTIEAAIKRHAVLIYFALVCVISGGGLLLIVGPGGVPLSAGRTMFGGVSSHLPFAGKAEAR